MTSIRLAVPWLLGGPDAVRTVFGNEMRHACVRRGWSREGLIVASGQVVAISTLAARELRVRGMPSERVVSRLDSTLSLGEVAARLRTSVGWEDQP